MGDFLQHLVDQPIANVIALAGLAFLFVAAVGKITGKIDPDTVGRVLSGVLGLILVPGGLFLHYIQDSKGAPPQPPPVTTVTSSSTPPRPKWDPPRAAIDRCKPGYVWRLAVRSDHVCVTLDVQTQVDMDNKLAPSRTNNSGPYGADTCKEPFVWREAVSGDHVCVSVETRQQAANDNALAVTRIAR